jgi:hypothetical protein
VQLCVSPVTPSIFLHPLPCASSCVWRQLQAASIIHPPKADLTSHCLALKKVCGPTGGPSAGGTTMRRLPPGFIPLMPSSKPANVLWGVGFVSHADTSAQTMSGNAYNVAANTHCWIYLSSRAQSDGPTWQGLCICWTYRCPGCCWCTTGVADSAESRTLSG